MNIKRNIAKSASPQYAAPMKVQSSQKQAENTPTEKFERLESSEFGNTMKRLGDLALATTAGAGAGIAAGALPILSIVGIGIAPFTMIAGGLVGAGTALGMEIFQPGQISEHAREALVG